MSIEVRPVGVTCNLRCSYCYEQSARDIEPVHRYNKSAVLAQLSKVDHQWSLFGGEALLVPIPDLEELLQIGFEQWGATGVQTNGTLITTAHIDLFEKYKTHVGISLDGPDELNDSRWAGTVEATRNMTKRTLSAIDMLLDRATATNNTGLIPSLIITLHAGNASVDRWPRMKEWLIDLDRRGLTNINFHLMELDFQATKGSEWYLPHERLKEVMLDLWDLSTKFDSVQVSNFREIVSLLRSDDQHVTCVWHACDPWNTAAVQGLEGDGAPSHCTRTNKDGIEWTPAEGAGQETEWQIGNFPKSNRHRERQLSLYVTPQEHGGCKDCRFWVMCMGQCPGTAEESVDGQPGDWRLRSTYCQTWKDLFEEGERRLLEIGEIPLSMNPNLKEIEQVMYDGWTEGSKEVRVGTAIREVKENMNMQNVLLQKNIPHGDHMDQHGDNHGDHINVTAVVEKDLDIPHGDHVDMSIQNIPHGDHVDMSIQNIPHGDHDVISPDNGDKHGDHLDMPIPNTEHGDQHGDQHGDHTDTANQRGRRRNSFAGNERLW